MLRKQNKFVIYSDTNQLKNVIQKDCFVFYDVFTFDR